MWIKRENGDKRRTRRTRERVDYLVCFLVFNNASVVHGLLSVRLERRTKILEKGGGTWNISNVCVPNEEDLNGTSRSSYIIQSNKSKY